MDASGRRTLLELGDDGSAGNVMGIRELRQQACGTIEVSEAAELFQFFAVGRGGQGAKLGTARF